jgi:hypothetical protein
MNEFRDTMDWNGLRFDTPRVDHVVYVAKMASVFPAQEREIKHPVGVQPSLEHTDRHDLGQPAQEVMSPASK